MSNNQDAVNHITSDGSDHGFIDQDVTNGAAPVLDATNFTNLSGGAFDEVVATTDSIATAITNAGANGTIFIQPGTHTPAGDLTFLAGQQVYFGGCEIDFAATGGGILIPNDNVSFFGRVKLTGDTLKAAGTGSLLHCTSDYFFGESCLIELEPSAASYATTLDVVVFTGANYCTANLIAVNQALTLDAAAWVRWVFFLGGSSYNKIYARGENLDAVTGAANRFLMISNAAGASYNDFIVLIRNITTTVANNGRGIDNQASNDWNTFRGTSRDCDNNNFFNSGGNTHSTGLNFS